MQFSQSGIYRIVNSLNGKVYVGSAKCFRTRWNTHRCLLRQGKHHSKHLQSAWGCYGESAFIFEIVELVSLESMLEREQYWIDALNACGKETGYNARPTAENQAGLKHSQDTIQKISKAKAGKPPWNKGIPMSDEAKEKLRIASSGRKHKPETIERMSAIRKGRKHSAETKALMSQIAKSKGRMPSQKALVRSIEVRKAEATPKEKQNGFT